jgi:hypothetical protein
LANAVLEVMACGGAEIAIVDDGKGKEIAIGGTDIT